MKSYVVKEREDGSRFFDENTPTGQVSEDTIGAGLKIDAEGKVVVDKDDLSSDFVKKTGDESIEGLKTFTAPVGSRVRLDMKNNNMECGERITSATYSQIVCVDKNDALVGALEVNQASTGTTRSVLVSYTPSDPSGSSGVNMGIGYRLSGDAFEAFTHAPTPPLTDKSTQIATTAWVKNVLPSANGFKVNPDGTVSVDFSQMDEATINNLKKELSVLIPLTKNTDFYINGATGSDTLDEGRGLTAEKPFKTIQSCLNYVSATYTSGRFNMTFHVAPGVYNENVQLPSCNSTAGSVSLVSDTISGATISVSSIDGKRPVENTSGTEWIVRGFKLIKQVDLSKITASTGDFTLTCCYASKAGSTIILDRCYCKLEATGARPSGITSAVYSYMIYADSNALVDIIGNNTFEFAGVKTPSAASVFVAGAGSRIILHKARTAYEYTFIIPFDINVFARSMGRSAIEATGTGNRPIMSGNVTAKRYEVTTGAYINTDGGGENYFPGTTAGSVEASTYAWYA